MFDYRYHALSLAAVLLALAVGVLIGVAIGDSNLVSSAKNGVVHDLRSEVSGANNQADHLRAQLTTQEALGNDLYQIAVHGLLTGRRVGLVFLGSPSDQIDGQVRDAITQAGGDLVTVVTVREPLDLAGLAREAAGTPYTALASEPRLVRRFGVRIARQLVGSDHVLLGKVQARLLSSFDGQLEGLNGLVVVRSEPEDMTSEASKTAGEFEIGLIEGATSGGVVTVGAELSTTNPSQISWYKSRDISSVDDLDTAAGRAALVFTLTGAHGSYGEKPSADSGLLPRVATGASVP
jgi:Copper transport outer membrane protein, MctB